MGLTKRKRAFIQAYCEDTKIGQTEAARKAGYSINRAKQAGYDLMRDPDVKREIERQLANKLGTIEQKARSKELTREAVIQNLNDIEEMCNQAGPGAWQVAGLLKVAELRGKMLKLFTERIEVGVDEKLIARLEAGRRNAGLKVLEAVPDPENGAVQ